MNDAASVVLPFRGPMTEAMYDAERARLRQLYGDSDAEAAAKRDQALAALFCMSGWTQEKLAKKEGMSQPWIVCRLRFGRFLSFITTVIKSESVPADLTERHFRDLWERTEGNERERFNTVIALMQNKPIDRIPVRRRRIQRETTKHDRAREALRPVIEAGKQIDREKWAARLGVSTGTVERAALQETARLEGTREGKATLISIHELIEKFVPLANRVREQSKRHVGLISVGELLMIASEIQRLLDSWADGDKTVRRVRGHVVPCNHPEQEGGT